MYDPAVAILSILGSIVAAVISARISFRLQVERFFGKDAEREKHHDERHKEVLRRLDMIEGAIRARQVSDRP